MMRRAVAMLVLATALSIAPAAHAACSRAAALADAVVAAQARYATTSAKDLETDLSADQQKAIADVRQTLGDFVTAVMACASPNRTEAIGHDLTARIKVAEARAGLKVSPEGEPAFDVETGAAHSNLVGVVSRFPIPCGEDAVLSVFDSSMGAWTEKLRWQAGRYKTVAGGLWALKFAISPRDAKDGWFVVTSSVAPWCSSTWSDLRYAVLRPGPYPLKPKQLLKRDDFMWWGSEDYGQLSAGADTADVRFHAASIDGGVHNRVWVRHFLVQGDRVRRVQPVAESPRDFVDEWITTPWSEARSWTEPTARDGLHRTHDRWNKSKPDGLEFEAARRCSGAATRYQIETSDVATNQTTYFWVAGGPDYWLTDVSPTADPRCAGPDILGTMATR
jgi:hypothetical protein